MTAPVAERAVVSDDGRETRLVLYVGAEAVAGLPLSPGRAIALSAALIAEASRRIEAALASRDTSPPARKPPTTSRQHFTTRGGDRQAGKRAQRDAGLRDLAALLGADLSLEQRAAEVIAKAGRYRPAQLDAGGSSERRVLRRIADAGLPLPGPRQLRRILTPRPKTSTPSQHFTTDRTALDS